MGERVSSIIFFVVERIEVNCHFYIKLLESPIPAPTAASATSSQKAHFDNISGTKRGTIDTLVSKRPEKNSE